MAPRPSRCHSDFAVAIDCSFQQVAGLQPVIPQKIADCLILIRNDLLKIIPKWEQSGHAEGGRDNALEQSNNDDEQEQEEDDSFLSTSIRSNASNIAALGPLSHRPARALQLRSSFLGGRPSYVLYYWEVVDMHPRLLQSS